MVKNKKIYGQELFQNKINKLTVRNGCTLEMITLIVDLFSRLEDLKIRTKHKETLPVIEHLLLYKNNLSNLFCLCIFEISIA